MREPEFHLETREAMRCSRTFRSFLFPACAARPIARGETPPSGSPQSAHPKIPLGILRQGISELFPRYSPKYRLIQIRKSMFLSTPCRIWDPPGPRKSNTASEQYRAY